jgi:hypothetical protein
MPLAQAVFISSEADSAQHLPDRKTHEIRDRHPGGLDLWQATEARTLKKYL